MLYTFQFLNAGTGSATSAWSFGANTDVSCTCNATDAATLTRAAP
jgi:hypothetical protein